MSPAFGLSTVPEMIEISGLYGNVLIKQCLVRFVGQRLFVSFDTIYLCISQVVVVHVNAAARLTFGGTDDAAGVVHLYSAGCLEPEKNNSNTKAIAEHLQKHFNIPVGR